MHQNTFDLDWGLYEKTMGMDDAAQAVPTALEVARQAVLEAARQGNGTASADDAYKGLLAFGYVAQDLGKAAGSIFAQKKWKYTGRRIRSARVSNHGRAIRVWRLRNFSF